MASTVIRGAQIKDSTVQRHDLDTSTVGQAVVTKIVQGTGVTLSSTGADSGTGDVTVSTSAIPLASSSASGLMNQTSGNTTDFIDGTNNSQPLQPVIWSVRLRSFNAVGNPNFEVAQRNCRTALVNPAHATAIEDRWFAGNVNALNPTFQGVFTTGGVSGGVQVPGTSYNITTGFMRVTMNTQKASLAASDFLGLFQNIEGPQLRELSQDVHSLSILCRSSVANLKFGISLVDPGGTRSLPKLCSLGAANTVALITLPNLPVWPSAGNFSLTPGNVGYGLWISLAAGSQFTPPANDSWQNGNFPAAVGQSNFLANAVGSTFEVFFVQHEPGAQCSTLIDCPFGRNLDGDMGCLRYFTKSYGYTTALGSNSSAGQIACVLPANSNLFTYIPFKKVMAKSPTVVAYSTDGTVNTVRDASASVNRAVNAVTAPTDSGFSGFNMTSTNPATAIYAFQYTADTGW